MFFAGSPRLSRTAVSDCRYCEGTGIGSPDICGEFEVRFRSLTYFASQLQVEPLVKSWIYGMIRPRNVGIATVVGIWWGHNGKNDKQYTRIFHGICRRILVYEEINQQSVDLIKYNNPIISLSENECVYPKKTKCVHWTMGAKNQWILRYFWRNPSG